MEQIDYGTVSLTQLRRIIKIWDKNTHGADMDFQYLVNSCFPDLYKNFVENSTKAWMEGYNQGKKEVLGELEK